MNSDTRSRPVHIVTIVLAVLVLLLAGCTTFSEVTPGPTPVPLTIAGLALYYPFNGDANDMSGARLNGVVNGASLTADRFGVPNRAYYFDGADDRVSFDAARMPLGSSPRTISAWVRVESYPAEAFAGLGSRATVIGWGIDDLNQVSEMQIVDGRLQFHCYGSDITGMTELELDRWYYLAIVYGDGAASLYVNGVEDGHGAASLGTPPAPGAIGAYPDPDTHGFDSSYFHGTIDDVAVYSQSLSEAQISTLYLEGGWGQ